MRKFFAICFYILAGFFVYMITLLAFINQPGVAKWGVVCIFTLPAMVSLCMGMAVNRFQNWKRHAGIVLLVGTGFACFVIFTVACFLMTDEFRQMLKQDTLGFFSAYLSGSIFIFSTATVGLLLLKTEQKKAEPSVSGDA